MNLESLGILLEGRLALEEGVWYIYTEDNKVTLEDVLNAYENAEVRLTLVSLENLKEIKSLLEGMDDTGDG